MGKKFVGLDGLKHFWAKAKSWIAGQITAEVTAKIAEIVANAPEDLNTLKEIADWISAHPDDAAAMNTQITANQNEISSLKTTVAGKAAASHTHDDRYYTESEVDTKLSGKSDTGHTHDDRYFTSRFEWLNSDNFTPAMNTNGTYLDGEHYPGWVGSLYTFYAGGSSSSLMFRILGGANSANQIQISYGTDSNRFGMKWATIINSENINSYINPLESRISALESKI
jgi:hypothetical protein